MILFAALTLGAAVAPLMWLARARFALSGDWLAASAAAVSITGCALLMGNWTLLSVHLRPLVAIAVIPALVLSRHRTTHLPAEVSTPPASRRRLLVQSAIACAFAILFVNALTGRVAPRGTVDLRFPLEGGAYGVIQGGSSLALNPFHRWFRSDKYALDLVKLLPSGNRARGAAPSDLNAYASFNEAVRSPCEGTVEAIRNDVPDNSPGDTDSQRRTGNHVFLRCGELRVLMAHLVRGSVTVSAGDAVRSGQLLGRVGNSGYTSEPHLHIGAMLARSSAWPDAEPAAVTFGGRFLAVNDVVKR